MSEEEGQELARRIEAANTREEIEAVKPLIDEWMRAHPRDRWDTSSPVWAATYKLQRRASDSL